MDAIFEISTLANPWVPNFIEIGQLLVFGHFLGGPTPKQLKFFAEKNARTKILTPYSYSAHSKTFVCQISVKSEDLGK